jgi:hypothetical protein
LPLALLLAAGVVAKVREDQKLNANTGNMDLSKASFERIIGAVSPLIQNSIVFSLQCISGVFLNFVLSAELFAVDVCNAVHSIILK